MCPWASPLPPPAAKEIPGSPNAQRSDKGDTTPLGMQRTQPQARVQNYGPDQDSHGRPGASFASLTLPFPHPWRWLLTCHEDDRSGTLCTRAECWAAPQPTLPRWVLYMSVCEPTPSCPSSAERGCPHRHCETLPKGRSSSSGGRVWLATVWTFVPFLA